jgi:serine/threonine protein kinase
VAECAVGMPPTSDATALANRLVKEGRLTAFQARHIYAGKARALVLGPYALLDVIGRGGMGCVYKAEHRKMRRLVAIKVIAKTALKSPEAAFRFEREVQAAARLEHPNIVAAFDAGEAAGTHYLVMQFVDGRNLSEVVRQFGPQPVGHAIDWIFQAAQGLAYAHDTGVVHRDIKPSNLLVDAHGVVKILDMGLARLESCDADQDQITSTGQIMGTVDYMAPEQAMDTHQADARSDIYALGATLWFLLTGQPLFTGTSAMSKLMAHMQRPAPLLGSVRDDVSPEIEAVFQSMVAKKPDDRFQSMQDVITALQSLPPVDTGSTTQDVAGDDGDGTGDAVATAARCPLPPSQTAVAAANTVRLSDEDVDTSPAIRVVDGARRRSRGPASSPARRPYLTLIGGTVVAFVIGGLLSLAIGGRRNAEPVGGDIGAGQEEVEPDPNRPM